MDPGVGSSLGFWTDGPMTFRFRWVNKFVDLSIKCTEGRRSGEVVDEGVE